MGGVKETAIWRVRSVLTIVNVVLILMIVATGQASAQDVTPTAMPSAALAIHLAAIPDGT